MLTVSKGVLAVCLLALEAAVSRPLLALCIAAAANVRGVSFVERRQRVAKVASCTTSEEEKTVALSQDSAPDGADAASAPAGAAAATPAAKPVAPPAARTPPAAGKPSPTMTKKVSFSTPPK